MSTYYVAGIPYSDELYHHGIKGQKWGLRRFQNEDGSLTAEGKARYGEDYGNKNSNSGIRKFLTGDHVLGMQRHREKRENRLLNKMNRLKSENKDYSKVQSKYEAQKQKNIDIERYISKTSTGKLFAQNYLLTGMGADSYRAARARGESRGRAFVEMMLPSANLNPLNMESILAKKRDKAKYGNLAHKEY